MVAVRICVSSWTAITTWRCAFILMEEGHIKLSQLIRMMDFRVPFSKPKVRVGWVVVIVLLLLFPQGIIDPLTTGAVGWSTSLQWVEKKVVNSGQYGSLDLGLATLFLNKSVIPNITSSYTAAEIDRLDWTAFVLVPSVVKALTIRSTGLVSTMWGVAGQSESSISVKSSPQPRALCRQRVTYTSGPIPVKSIVYGSDLPCILVGNIRWQRPSKQIQEVVAESGAFSIFGSRLEDYTMPGSAALFDPEQQTLKQMYLPKGRTEAEGLLPPPEFPTPETFIGSLSLLVLRYLASHQIAVWMDWRIPPFMARSLEYYPLCLTPKSSAMHTLLWMLLLQWLISNKPRPSVPTHWKMTPYLAICRKLTSNQRPG